MTFLTVPSVNLYNRLKYPIDIAIPDEEAAITKLLLGMIQLIPGVTYPYMVEQAARLAQR